MNSIRRMSRRFPAIITAAILTFMISGCGIAYEANRSQLLKTATVGDFGPRPPANYQDIESDMIRDMLKDPDSAKIRFGELTTDAIQSGFASPKAILIWKNDALVNAKNSYGGYVGFQAYHFAWRDGHIIAVAFPIVTEYGASDGNWQYLK